jgi:hypothetical protein
VRGQIHPISPSATLPAVAWILQTLRAKADVGSRQGSKKACKVHHHQLPCAVRDREAKIRFRFTPSLETMYTVDSATKAETLCVKILRWAFVEARIREYGVATASTNEAGRRDAGKPRDNLDFNRHHLFNLSRLPAFLSAIPPNWPAF